MMTLDNLKVVWDKLQAFLDIDGDLWMALFTIVILLRLLLVLKGYLPLTAAEAGTYGTAVLAFAYSNRGPKAS